MCVVYTPAAIAVERFLVAQLIRPHRVDGGFETLEAAPRDDALDEGRKVLRAVLPPLADLVLEVAAHSLQLLHLQRQEEGAQVVAAHVGVAQACADTAHEAHRALRDDAPEELCVCVCVYVCVCGVQRPAKPYLDLKLVARARDDEGRLVAAELLRGLLALDAAGAPLVLWVWVCVCVWRGAWHVPQEWLRSR